MHAHPFYVRQAVYLLLTLLLLLWLDHFPALDFWLAARFFDPASGHFPLQASRWLDVLNHQLAKDAVIAAGLWLGWQAWRHRNRLQAVAVLAMGLSTAMVSWLKSLSAHSCPWDLQAFGGHASWFALLSPVPPGAGPGHCFPAGHASGGFALLALWYWQREVRPAQAGRWLVLALGYGSLMGLGQMARGAHFLSHTLWSAWWVWLVCWAVFVFDRQLRPGVPQAATGLSAG